MEALRPQDPRVIGPHTVLARLGSGGMGQVYLGRSPGGRQLAIKVIRDDFAQNAEALARFRREVETVRAVRSAYTANLIDASLEAAPYWLATEYVPGPTLTQVTAGRGPLPVDTCFRLFAALAEALSHVHEHGVTHRDLKPHNIILSPVGPKLIDFGIARGAEQTALTQVGTAPGTPGYTAPEVITRNEVSAAADVFALGATMAAVATGRPPYGEGSMESVTYRVVHGEIDAEGVDAGLAELIRACVAADPAARPVPARIIERCGVTSSLVDDPVYGPLAELGERAPRDLPAAVAAGLVPAPPAGVPYTPTYVPGVATVPRPKRRRAVYLAVGAGAVALGVALGLVVTLPDDKGEGESGGVAQGKGVPSAASGSSTAAPQSAGTQNPLKRPEFIEATDTNHDFWAPKKGSEREGSCGQPPEERSGGQFQWSIVDAQSERGGVMSGKVKIEFRFKYAGSSVQKPYYVSVAVKSPHDIDPDTGKPFEKLRMENRGLGYTSKPIDIAPKDSTGWGSDFASVTYPDDFQDIVKGKPVGSPIPVGNDPGNWTVLFLHAKGAKEYASIECSGFVAR
ncbi:serine/threonine protein kinase [Streptomyces sp. AV19]|uniref:serine/threonine-protein kinase n=1 Tax=Streptomyces sp. AV19 TaxID=2793068 RepID=UPI0018FE97A6|nr:serine/threonine-protein kinase [Streptomyces sp. AV19]MBH1936189.1 serine/threonine protein kinase [Streptomyces sp. AV19]MDG4534623.1 serine/threonine protein kinase [Streptomyces sp. AV19]